MWNEIRLLNDREPVVFVWGSDCAGSDEFRIGIILSGAGVIPANCLHFVTFEELKFLASAIGEEDEVETFFGEAVDGVVMLRIADEFVHGLHLVNGDVFVRKDIEGDFCIVP